MDIAVLDPLPLFRQGVLAALGGGRALASPAELRQWLTVTAGGVLLLTMHDEETWANLSECGRRTDVATVALLPSFDVATAAGALRAGAAHVVPRDTDARGLTVVLDEVVAGTVRIPVPILRATIAARPDSRRAAPSPDELEWLRALAGGATVASLAEGSGYSERALYRRFKLLYDRLGVRGRTEAMILARDEGWI